jgi:outer membrane protein TolC
VATGNDATRSELELASADLAVTNGRQAVLAARLSLGDLVGREVFEPLQDPEPAALAGRDLAEYERIALRERPDFRSTELRMRATELQARSARLGLVPTLGVQGSWGLNDTDPNPGVATSPQWTVALVAQWDLYDGGNREATAAAFDATLHEQGAAYRGVRRDLHRDLATALGAFATAEASVGQADTQLRVAKVNLDEVQQRFRQGLATALQAADASASLFQAESDLTSRKQDLANSRFQLRNLLGRWPLADTAPVEQEAKGAP